MRTALTLEPFELPVQPTRIFFAHTGHAHHTPPLALPGVIAHELREQMLPIDAIGLGARFLRLTSMLEESTTTLQMPRLTKQRCSQKPSRPAS
jgi:hypothetical protein